MFGSPTERITAKTANYTVQLGDDLILVDASAGAVTITLYDPNGKYPIYPDQGRVKVVKTDTTANPVTVATAAGSIIGQAVLRQQGQSAEFICDGIATWFNFTPIQGTFEVQKALSAADIIAMRTTPVALVPAPGANNLIIVEDIVFKMVRTATAFTGGGAVEFRYTDGAGAKVTADVSAILVTGAAGTAYSNVAGVTTELTPVANAAIVITNATAAFATGTGTGVVSVKYRVLTP